MTTILRPIRQQDQAFLYRLYASTREEELALLDWDASQKEAFLRMQFEAQHRYYMEQFSQAEFNIILAHGQPIGRLYVDHRKDEIRIIDIALLPAHRNQGIGTSYLKKILLKGQLSGRPVRIHVEVNNPALRLYNRLGFREIDENGVYFLMEWAADKNKNGN